MTHYQKKIRQSPHKGFTVIEVVVSIGILSFILLVLNSFIFQINYLHLTTKADRQALENAKKVLDIITYEIKGAESIYTPTTSVSQLSLQTTRYLPLGESSTFIDFFMCASGICLKKESQAPILLTVDNVEAQTLDFEQITNGNFPSVKINITIRQKNPTNNPQAYSSVNLTSTVALRKY